ncbi:MAG TPA: glycerol kinase GlpK [Sphaerochaeta sp.]|nr:glycerol kinase GlpK [Sphaerochaeta sp.]
MDGYILAIDQSTSTTKALLFDQNGALVARKDKAHRQIVNELGWVEHDGQEIVENLYHAIVELVTTSNIGRAAIKGVAIANQRETTIAWDRTDGRSLANAIVWQCGRAQAICDELEDSKSLIHTSTGLHLSPYFSAAKMAWLLRNEPTVAKHQAEGTLVLSTMDSFLLYHLSEEKVVKTEPSNASRTQLMNIQSGEWDQKVAGLFGIPITTLPHISDSNALFGHTTLGGLLAHPVPIHGVLGDSQGALYAQGCLEPGMIKTTYGTGSSIMMNIGEKGMFSEDLVTSIAWSLDGKLTYVLEGNINYSGATITYLVEDLGLLENAKQVASLAASAKDIEGLYLVPAFSGLGAPYWNAEARGLITGLDRRCTKAEIARAAEQAIAYQIADIIFLMDMQSGHRIRDVRADGGASKDAYLMQFQADVLQCPILVSAIEELSGLGPALLCAEKCDLIKEGTDRAAQQKRSYLPHMTKEERDRRYAGWKQAVQRALMD